MFDRRKRFLGKDEEVKCYRQSLFSVPLHTVYLGGYRSEMEELCAPLFERVEQTLLKCLAASGLKQEDISEIELIGGSTRMPAVKTLIEQVFGKPPSTTLNQDECVARGAAIMAAMLSPSFKVREFSLTDLQPYAINLSWGGEDVEHG